MTVQYTREAAKQIEKLHQPTKGRIRDAILELPEGDVKKLKGCSTKYRLRVGDYRVIFDMCHNVITIGEILPRGEAYKRL